MSRSVCARERLETVTDACRECATRDRWVERSIGCVQRAIECAACLRLVAPCTLQLLPKFSHALTYTIAY